MRRFLLAIGTALRNAFRMIWDPIKRTMRLVVETVPAVASGLGQAVEGVASGVLSVPGALLRSVLGQHAPVPDESQVAKAAAAAQQATKRDPATVVDAADYGLALRSAARRLARGRDLPGDLVQRLGVEAVSYLSALTVAEAKVLASEPGALVAAHVAGQRQADGVRSVGEVARDLDAMRGVESEEVAEPEPELEISPAPAPRPAA